jgi:nicotinamidase-related amidase
MSKVRIALKIDQQVGFVTGSLANPLAVARLPYLVDKAKRQRQAGWVFLGTKDTHSADANEYLQSQEGQKLPVWHCGLGTADHDIVPELRELYETCGIRYIAKPNFGSPELVQVVQAIEQEQGIEVIELDGFVTEICVVSNALLLKAYLPEVRVVVDGQGCAGLSVQAHDEALNVVRACQVEVV